MTRQIGAEAIRRDDRSVVTTGTFDGVHLGHQAILRYLVGRAREIGGVATAVTFDPHPRDLFGGPPVPLLTTIEERADLMEGLGLDRFVVLPFTRDLSMMEAEAYVEEVLMGTVGLREIVIGYDHRFGRDRAGTRETLEGVGARRGFTVETIPAWVEAGVHVSSTQVRRALVDEGDARRAAQLLGRPYSFAGTVVRGDQRGRTIGYPTANVRPESARKVVPRAGVYAVRVALADGRVCDGMMNVGLRPTFGEATDVRIEAHLFGFSGDLYGTRVRVYVVARLRDERRFEGVEALVAQLGEDRAAAERALAAAQ